MRYIICLTGSLFMIMSNLAFAGAAEGHIARNKTDIKKAFIEYSECAEQGDAECQYWLGQLHQVALGGMAQDLNKTIALTRKSANQGYALAQYAMGEFYQHAFGLPKDMKKAEEYYRKAAANNYAPAKDVLYKDFHAHEFKPAKIKLNAAQMKFLFNGTTVSALHLKDGLKYKIYFDTDGNTAYRSQNGKVEKTTYKIKENIHCVRWKDEERCSTITANGDSTYTKISLDGVPVVRWTNLVRGKKL